jgi:hypothetical protein
VVRKFTNRFTNLKQQSLSTQPHVSSDQYFINLPSNLTGRQLFEQEHKEDINDEATRRRKDANNTGSHAGFYQAVLKERWESEDTKDTYEKMAEENANDVER